jgi:4-amino-4-deoxy-L-arabinose transferase-like glycosyltransferase
VSAAAALLTVMAVYVYALPRLGLAGALAAGLVLATSGAWLGLARLVTLDMTLTALVVGGVLAGLAWLERPRRPPLAPYVLAALGALVKGPIAFALVGGPLALAVAIRRPRPGVAELGLLRGTAVAALIVALLYVPVGLLDASYLRGFLWTNVRRLGADAPHAAPAWYYLVWLPVLLLPWTPLAVPAIARAARDPARRALVLWAVFVPAFLTLAHGKLATYALSALPPLALLAGPELARTVLAGPAPEDVRMLRIAGWVTAVGIAALAVAIPVARLYLPLSWPGMVLLSAAALGWAVGLGLAARRAQPSLVPAAVLGTALTLYPLAVRFVAPAVSAVHSDREFARLVAATDGAAPVITFAAHAPSLVFYLERPVVHSEDEQVVRDLFDGDGPVFLVAGHRHFENVERLLGERAYCWSENARRRLYGNRPPPPRVDGGASQVRRNGSR